VRLASRLRWHLVQIAPELEAQIRPQGLIGPQIRAKVARGLARLPSSPQVRVARAILKRINEIYREEGELLAEVKALIEAHCPQLLAEHGCGTVTAAIIIGHTAGAERFAHRRSLRPTGRSGPHPCLLRTLPIATACIVEVIASSTGRYTPSLSPVPRIDPDTRAYLERKRAEGKTSREALRCLKRHLRTPHTPPPLTATDHP